MRVPARVRANRANAKHSTGPKSKAGKARSAQNAYTHGLSIPAGMLQECSPAVKAYVEQIVGEGASGVVRAAATAFAEAQVDIDRVRRMRLALYEDKDARTKKWPIGQTLKAAIGILKLNDRIQAIPDDLQPIYEFREALPALVDFFKSFKLHPDALSLEGGMHLLAPKLAKLWRYERRALSRRDKAAKRLQLIYALEEETSA